MTRRWLCAPGDEPAPGLTGGRGSACGRATRIRGWRRSSRPWRCRSSPRPSPSTAPRPIAGSVHRRQRRCTGSPGRSHEPVDLPGPTSRANQAAAFASIARSSRRRRFSRRSRRISSRSALLNPSARRPSSRSACANQLRIAWAVGSNCLPSADNNTAIPEPALPESVRCEPARPSGAGRPAEPALRLTACRGRLRGNGGRSRFRHSGYLLPKRSGVHEIGSTPRPVAPTCVASPPYTRASTKPR